MPRGIYPRKKFKRDENKRMWGVRYGKKKKEPPEDSEELFKYKCDKLVDELGEKFRREAKVFTKDSYSQEFLRTLVSPKSLYK